MPAILSWINAVEQTGVSITTTSEAAGLGIRSVLTPQISDVWRSGPWSAFAVIDIDIDLGAARSDLRLFMLAAPADGVLPNSDAQCRITASNVALGGSEALDTTGLPFVMGPNGLYVFLAPANITARWVRFRLRAGATDSYVQIGRLWAGPALLTSRSASYGAGVNIVDLGANDRGDLSGVRYARRGRTRRVASWQLQVLAEAEGAQIEAMARAVGTTGQVFACRTTLAPARDGMLGRLTEAPRIVASSYARCSATIDIEEDA